jgi:hypothetical protein
VNNLDTEIKKGRWGQGMVLGLQSGQPQRTNGEDLQGYNLLQNRLQ